MKRRRRPRPHTGAGIILLVEDEDAVRALNARMLISRGYTVHEAASGVEALDIFLRHDGKIDLVVSDVVMPEWTDQRCSASCASATRTPRSSSSPAMPRKLPQEPARGRGFQFPAQAFTMKQLVETVKAAMG